MLFWKKTQRRAAVRYEADLDQYIQDLGHASPKCLERWALGDFSCKEFLPSRLSRAERDRYELAAAKLLAQRGTWTLEILRRHFESGWQRLLKDHQPIYAIITDETEFDDFIID